MEQLSTNFDDSENLKMNDLTFYNALGSADLRKQQAIIIADQLDNIFRIGRGAQYETNINRTTAISNIVQILTDEEKLVKELALTVDDAYNFWGETK